MFTAPKGVPEYLPPDSADFLAVREALAAPARRAGYGYVELPVFEDTALFVRGVGESTDVVSKEMYTFEDRGGRSISLRPEGTAGVMRSVVEHRPRPRRTAGQALVRRAVLPRRATAAGPLPTAPAGRHRGHRGRRSGPRRRGHRAGGRGVPLARTDAVHAPADLAGLRGLPPGLPRAPAGVPGHARPRRAHAGTGGDQPAARPRRQAPRRAGAAGRRAPHGRPPVRGLPGPLRRRARLPARPGGHLDRGAPAGARPGLLHPHHLRVRARRSSAPSRASAAAVATTGSWSRSAGRRSAGIGWGIGTDRTFLACRAEGLEPGAGPAVDVFTVAIGSRHRGVHHPADDGTARAGVCGSTWRTATRA